MAKTTQKITRRQQILEALSSMLAESPGSRITTAALAKKVGVSEAALYRHFPSKTKMFECLIEFIEDTLFAHIKLIVDDVSKGEHCCEKILVLLLNFSERNPGITRILTGDALAGETDRLRQRVIQLFDRIETQLKHVLRNAEVREEMRTHLPANITANTLLAIVEGRMAQYVRSEFKRLPTENWSQQWSLLVTAIFVTEVVFE